MDCGKEYEEKLGASLDREALKPARCRILGPNL